MGDNETKLALLNSLLEDEFISECDGLDCYFVEVELTENVKSVLRQLGKDDKWIDTYKIITNDEVEMIDLCQVAWDYANWFTGNTFINKEL